MLEKVLRMCFCMIFVSVMAAQAYTDPENIVGIWLLDEGSGGVAADSSGNGHDGQIQNATWTDGRFGKALLFEGDGEVRIESTEKLQLGDQLTMMAYFRAQALNDWHQLIAKHDEYLLRIDPPHEGGNMSAFVNLDGDWEPRSSAGVPDMDVWTHFAAVYSSVDGKLRTYVDGVPSGEIDRIGSPNPGDDAVTIGHWGGSSRFIGIVDEVAIFDVALEAEDILNIARNGLKAYLAIPTKIDIKPDTLNLKSKGEFTAFIDLPESYNEGEIDVDTVECEGALALKGMLADDGKLIVKFDRADLDDLSTGDAVKLTVTGELTDGTVFVGSDIVKVISPGKPAPPKQRRVYPQGKLSTIWGEMKKN